LNELMIKLRRQNISLLIDENVEQSYQEFLQWRKIQLDLKKDCKCVVPIDVKLRKPLYPFQTSGTQFMINSPNVINADVVGLGKTVQAIASSEYRLQHDIVDYALVVCPANLKDQWSGKYDSTAGIEAFSYHKSIIVEGTKKGRNKKYHLISNETNLDTKYVIISYATLVSDMSNDSGLRDVLDLLSEKRFYLSLDEIQYIKGYDSKRSESVAEIIQLKGRKGVCGLTATPIGIMLGELFTIFKAVDMKVFGEQYENFARKYLKFDYMGEIEAYKNLKVLKYKIAPYMIRRRKEEVSAQLPKLIYKNYWIDLSPEQRKVYNDIKKKITTRIFEGEKKDQISMAEAMNKVMYLRQVCLSTELVDAKVHSSSKLRDLIQILKENTSETDKIIVFCYFKKMVEIINRTLNENGIKSLYIHGSSPKPGKDVVKQRDAIVKRFSEEDFRVLVTSDVLGTGYDKLKTASILVNFDIRWNPEKMTQRTGRCDRLGQKSDTIIIISLISNNTIESNRMYEILKEREALSHDVIDNNFKYKRMTFESIGEII